MVLTTINLPIGLNRKNKNVQQQVQDITLLELSGTGATSGQVYKMMELVLILVHQIQSCSNVYQMSQVNF